MFSLSLFLCKDFLMNIFYDDTGESCSGDGVECNAGPQVCTFIRGFSSDSEGGDESHTRNKVWRIPVKRHQGQEVQFQEN